MSETDEGATTATGGEMVDNVDDDVTMEATGDATPEKSKAAAAAEKKVEDSRSQKDSSTGKTDKIEILLKATGGAAIMKQKKWVVESSMTVAAVMEFIRKYLRFTSDTSIFLYVNQKFAPAPDVMLAPLYDCFGSDGRLVLHYCQSQAWG